MSEPTYHPLSSIAEDLGVSFEDVEAVAMVELSNDEWDDDMEQVTDEGRRLLLVHFSGGADPDEG